MLDRIKKRIVGPYASLIEAMKQVNNVKVKMLLVFSGDYFEGIITIGDEQRAIIKNVPLDTPASDIVDNDKKYAHSGESFDGIRQKMLFKG